MIVTFVSECQKNSLKLTRKVLDAYAHRIGQRTWQAVMTEQGLQAVRSRLSQTARKTTAVACHRVRGARRTELLWIVGNRRRFDDQGNVAVNRTARDLLREHDENDWQYLSTLKSIVAIAGLFHDFGKAWLPFQKILQRPPKSSSSQRDPVRHEWISLLLFFAFVQNKADEDWLVELAQLSSLSAIDRKKLSKSVQDSAKAIAKTKAYPFDVKCSTLAGWIAWLIVSHHRLPRLELNEFGESQYCDEDNLLCRISSATGFEKLASADFDYDKVWKFNHDLPFVSSPWCTKASRWGRKLNDELELFGPSRIRDLVQCQRLMLTMSRMVLMLGDHQYSSKAEDSRWRTEWQPFANTYTREQKERRTGKVIKSKGEMRQKLDEHLVRVAEEAVDIGHLLPAFESQLPTAQNVRPVRKPSPAAYAWQNRAVSELRRWQQEYRHEEMGFFAVNMASTGKGKTFANAKIMDAISPHGMRYSLALGLRTLTLQTGDEYREKLKLDQNELAVLIGAAAVRVLHQQRQLPGNANLNAASYGERIYEEAGSESRESLSTGFQFAYDDLIPDDTISTVLPDKKSRQLLKSPVLVSTIDHLMPAAENVRGGKQILPMLRMISSDLVIDEVDDFDHVDMPAIARLVHLAGMLGRKVMISSATIPPAIAEGLFHAYREGWQQFAKFRNRQLVVAGFWVDEYAANASRIASDAEFQAEHAAFVKGRLRSLGKESQVPCRAEIRSMVDLTPFDRNANASEQTHIKEGDNALARVDGQTDALKIQWFNEIKSAAVQLHRQHSFTDEVTGKMVSLGVIRVANVDPCIDLATHLLQCELPNDVELRVMSYHARQVLLLRSEQEKYLDDVLNRKEKRSPLTNRIIRRHVSQSDKPNVIFVLVASPVAEVGRDHDFDWAVIEPSSMRSIIQMSGRVRRHRKSTAAIQTPNVVLPELNYKAFTGSDAVVFHHPGFEGGNSNRGAGYRLLSKCLNDLVDGAAIGDRLDAASRIFCSDALTPRTSLVDLEHQVLRNVLTNHDLRPAFVKGWTSCAYYLTDLAQRASPFRQSAPESTYKLHVADDESLVFRHMDPGTGKSDGPQGKQVTNLRVLDLPAACQTRLWISLDYVKLIEHQQVQLGKSQRQACEFLGDLRLRDDEGSRMFYWNPMTGARKA